MTCRRCKTFKEKGRAVCQSISRHLLFNTLHLAIFCSLISTRRRLAAASDVRTLDGLHNSMRWLIVNNSKWPLRLPFRCCVAASLEIADSRAEDHHLMCDGNQRKEQANSGLCKFSAMLNLVCWPICLGNCSIGCSNFL